MPMTTDVKKCSRCGLEHAGLVLRPLTKAMAPDDAGGRRWSHWAPCPTNGEPIMVQVDDGGRPIVKTDGRVEREDRGVGHE